jgi:hypothetical protein
MTTTWAVGAPDKASAFAAAGAYLAAVERVQYLHQELFDRAVDGSAGAGLDPTDPLIGELNELRSALGWLPVDADGRWCWPE